MCRSSLYVQYGWYTGISIFINFPPFCLEGSRGGQSHYMLNVPTEGWHIRITGLFTTCSTLHLNFCYTTLSYFKYVSSKTARAKSVSITWTDPLPNRVRISAGLLALWRQKVLSFPSPHDVRLLRWKNVFLLCRNWSLAVAQVPIETATRNWREETKVRFANTQPFLVYNLRFWHHSKRHGW